MCIRDRNMIFIIDSSMKIRECNKKAQELLGVGRDEAVQRYIFEFIEAEDIEETLRTKEPVIHKKIQLEHGRMTEMCIRDRCNGILIIIQNI